MQENKSYAGSYIGKDTILGYTLSVYRRDGTSAHFIKYDGRWCFVTTGTHSAQGDKLTAKIIPCTAPDKINTAAATIFFGDKLVYDNSGTRADDYPEYYINAEELQGLEPDGGPAEGTPGEPTGGMPEVPSGWTAKLDELLASGEITIRRLEGCEKAAGAYAGKDRSGTVTLSIYNSRGESGHFVKRDDRFFMEFIGTFSLSGNNDMTTHVAAVAAPDEKSDGKAFFERQRKITHKEGGIREPEYTEYSIFAGGLSDFCKKMDLSVSDPDGTIPDEWQQPLETLWNSAMSKQEINPPLSAEEQHGDALLYVTAVSDSKSLDDYSDKTNYFCFVGITTGGAVTPLHASVRKEMDAEAWISVLEELKKQDGREVINFVYEAWSGSGDAMSALAKVYPNAKGYEKAYSIPYETPFKQKFDGIKYKISDEVKKVMDKGPFVTLSDIEARARSFAEESRTAFAAL